MKKVGCKTDNGIGSNIKLARKYRGIAQNRLGDLLGVTYQQIQKYENGKSRISAESLYRISKELNFPLEFFFMRKGVENE